jgi:hypothetical protein
MSEKPRPVVDLQARCACGAVEIRVQGPIWSMFLCTCRDCQIVTGAGHSAVAIADPADVTVSGTLKNHSRSADSGATFTRYFCPDCGTTLYATTSRRTDAMLLPAGLFGPGDWFEPTQVIFGRSHAHWDTLPVEIPVYETYRPRSRET